MRVSNSEKELLQYMPLCLDQVYATWRADWSYREISLRVFADARVRLGSVPASVLFNLARAIDVKTQHFIAHLQRQHGTPSAVAFKADIKPQGQSVMEYDEFIESLSLDKNEAAALKRLAGSNGPH